MINKIRFKFLSDTHLGFDFPIKPKIERRRRGNDFYNNFELILSEAIIQKVDFVIHGGDLFFRSKLPKLIINKTYELLFRYADKGLPIVIVPGNHERSVLPASILLNHPNIFGFDELKYFDFDINEIKVRIFGFPNIRSDVTQQFMDFSQFIEANVNKERFNILAMHQAIEGSKVEKYTFKFGKDVLAKNSIFSRFDLILSGHIHRQQIMFYQNNQKKIPIIYSGSIERTSFQEKNESKGYFDLEILKQMNDFRLNYRFKILPARPMEDFSFNGNESYNEAKTKLLNFINKIDKNSIIRIKSSNEISSELKIFFRAENLRSIVPETINIEISGRFFRST